ncbi:MAG: hypothetical protein HY719_00665 [Planctomycetes bacterium]|nr:hypothetical protein [Planctomycetota bacterium]
MPLESVLTRYGRVIGVSSIARDITERKRAEEQAGTASQYARSLIEATSCAPGRTPPATRPTFPRWCCWTSNSRRSTLSKS